MLATTSVGLALDYLISSSEKTSGISIMSGFGEITVLDPKQTNLFGKNTYQDNTMTFQISKPDNVWELRPASEEFSDDKLNLLKSKGYLDGIYVEKQKNKRFLITVFEIKQENFQLKDYVETQIQQMKQISDVTVPIKQISSSNDWAIFSMNLGNKGEYSYGEQILFHNQGKLYMLQYSGNSPENLSDEEKSDFNFIMNSFEVI